MLWGYTGSADRVAVTFARAAGTGFRDQTEASDDDQAQNPTNPPFQRETDGGYALPWMQLLTGSAEEGEGGAAEPRTAHHQFLSVRCNTRTVGSLSLCPDFITVKETHRCLRVNVSSRTEADLIVGLDARLCFESIVLKTKVIRRM